MEREKNGPTKKDKRHLCIMRDTASSPLIASLHIIPSYLFISSYIPSCTTVLYVPCLFLCLRVLRSMFYLDACFMMSMCFMFLTFHVVETPLSSCGYVALTHTTGRCCMIRLKIVRVCWLPGLPLVVCTSFVKCRPVMGIGRCTCPFCFARNFSCVPM